MKALVTGGAGFIGRWVCKALIEKGIDVSILDDLSNSTEKNFEEFKSSRGFHFYKCKVEDRNSVEDIFKKGFDICIHAAAQIDVQESLENPDESFNANILGTFNVLEAARKSRTKVVIVGTCMVYEMANEPITEQSRTKPLSPYAASKLAAEELALSYYYGYGLPTVILRPFNTYGPFQKTNMEGSVATIFIKNKLRNEDIKIFGDGAQTRDLMYVEDCADFIVRASLEKNAEGEIINAGTGKDISINELASIICKNPAKIKKIPHHHPQSEIKRLVAGYGKAEMLLGWHPKTSLEDGIKKTEEWLANNPDCMEE